MYYTSVDMDSTCQVRQRDRPEPDTDHDRTGIQTAQSVGLVVIIVGLIMPVWVWYHYTGVQGITGIMPWLQGLSTSGTKK
jgi:hypothetical protein